MITQRIILVFLTSLWLSVLGCATFHAKPLIPEQSLEKITHRTLKNAQLMHLSHPENTSTQRWNIDQLTLAALFYHPDFALAQQQISLAEAAKITAAQRPNPSINLSPTFISNISSVMPWLLAGSVSIPIETAGKRQHRLDQSAQTLRAAQLRLNDTAWLIRQRLRLALVKIFASQQSIKLITAQLALEQAIQNNLIDQLAAGEISQTEVLATYQAVAKTQLALISEQKKAADNTLILAEAIGIPSAALNNIEIDWHTFSEQPQLSKLPLAHLKQKALLSRSDLLAVQADYDSAQAAIHLEIANQYPNLQLNPSYLRNLLENRWGMGIQALQLPIFNQNEGPIAEKNAQRELLKIRFDSLQLRIAHDIERSYSQLEQQQQRLNLAAQQEALSTQHVQTIATLVDAGEQDELALNTAKLALNQAQQVSLSVHIENQQALTLFETTLRYPIYTTLTDFIPAP